MSIATLNITLGRLFGPVMLVWFAVIGGLGLAQVARHPEVLAALSPHHAAGFLGREGWRGFTLLGAVVLAVVFEVVGSAVGAVLRRRERSAVARNLDSAGGLVAGAIYYPLAKARKTAPAPAETVPGERQLA